MKYIDSQYPFAAALRCIDSYFDKKKTAVAVTKCELLTKPPPALAALRSFVKLAKCFPGFISNKKSKISLLRRFSTVNLDSIVAHEDLFVFDLCLSMAPGYSPTPVDQLVRSMSRHPGCTNDLVNRLKTSALHPKHFSYTKTPSGQLCIQAIIKSDKSRADRDLGVKLLALLAAASKETTKVKTKQTPAAVPTSVPQAKSVTPAAKALAQKPAVPTVLPTAVSQAPLAPASAPATPHALPQVGILFTFDRHTVYLVRSRTVAAKLANAIVDLGPDRVALAATGDHVSRDQLQAIDVIQIAIANPNRAFGQNAPLVFLWDLARAATADERSKMLDSLARVLAAVVASGGQIVCHDMSSLGEAIITQDWFDLGSVVDTNRMFTEWCVLAHEAQGLLALLDSYSKDPNRKKVSSSLVMSAAQRAQLIAPVAQERVSPALVSGDAFSYVGANTAQLNTILRACHLPLDNSHETIKSLVHKDLVAFHASLARHSNCNNDADDVYFNTDSGPLIQGDDNSGIGAASCTPPPVYERKPYWSLHSDPNMLARAAACRVDQLLAALQVMDANVALLTDWKRRATTYLTATQFLHRDQWSLNPRLPKYIPVQARFTNDGRFMWRYRVSVAGDGENEQDIGTVGASSDLQLVHDQFAHRTEQEVQDLLALLPARVREAIHAIPNAIHNLNEVILDLGEPARLRFFALDQAAIDLKDIDRVSEDDIDAIVEGRMFSSDRRGGINGQLHRISWVANREGKAIGLTIRVGRACPPGEGVTQMLLDLVKRGESVLFLGKPGSGKTHTLRDFVARLSDSGNNVMIVDTSNEVGGPGDVKHFSLHKARRLQVRDRSRQFEVLLEAVQNHTPDIVCIDEISDAKEVAAARSVATRVKGMIATAHGDLESILRNKVMRDLVGGLQTATVGDARAKELGGRKTVTTRAEESLFTTVVELVSRTEVRVFRDVNKVVDAIVAPHGFPWAERRWLPLQCDGASLGCSAPTRVGNMFFFTQVEPFDKPDLEAPQG